MVVVHALRRVVMRAEVNLPSGRLDLNGCPVLIENTCLFIYQVGKPNLNSCVYSPQGGAPKILAKLANICLGEFFGDISNYLL